MSALFCWPCSISINLSPSPALLVSALFCWQCSISIHLSPRSVAAGVQHFYSSPRSVTGGVRPFPLAMQHFYSFVSQVCHCWCPPFSAGDATFLFVCLPGLSLVVSALFCRQCSILFICFPGLSLLVSALFRWPCSISIHLSPRLVTGGVRPFLLFLFICLPGHVAFLFICLPGLSLPVSALFRWPCSISIHLPGLSLLVSALVRWSCSISIHVSPRPVTGDVRSFPLAM